MGLRLFPRRTRSTKFHIVKHVSFASIGPKLAGARSLFTGKGKNLLTDRMRLVGRHKFHTVKVDSALRGFASSNLLELRRGLDPTAFT